MSKKILILTTGGTISSSSTPKGLLPTMTSDELLSYLPEISSTYQLDTLEICSIDSTDMTWRQWKALAEAIQEHYEEYDGFVICHGTDTMAFTAAALSYMIQASPKPIVLTGAQKPIKSDITDAKANLQDSILYALDENSCGVQIVFDGEVIAGTRGKKTKSFSFDAFSSINFPDLAVIRNSKIIRYIQPGLTAEGPLFFTDLNPRVFLLKLTPGMEPDILAHIFEKYDCAILESFGVGGIPETLLAEFCRQMERYRPEEKVLIMTTQVTYEGSSVGTYQVGYRLMERVRFLEAYDMTLEAVFTKIMWVMSQPDLTWEKIEELFYTTINYDLYCRK